MECKTIMDVHNEYKQTLAKSLLLFTLGLSMLLEDEKKTSKKTINRSCGTRYINRKRRESGFFNTYYLSMKEHDPEMFFKYTRMDKKTFQKLLKLVKPHVKLPQLKLPNRISLEERLVMTLHFLSQGSSLQTIAWTYHVGHSTIHYIVYQMCQAIWLALNEVYLKPPSNPNEWREVADGFRDRWQFPNCIGALDGKHIDIQAPPRSGSLFFNYKKNFSIVLMAACNADYLFTSVDVGAYGSESDGGVFSQSIFGKLLEQKAAGLPEPTVLPNTNISMPFVLVADEAFPLKDYIMRPYPGRGLDYPKRIFNYRLSRARRVIENSFGILVSRWRILRTTITALPENVDGIVKATVCLHNFIKMEAPNRYSPPGYTDGDVEDGLWRREVDPLPSISKLPACRARSKLYGIRDSLRDYFVSSTGSIIQQNRI